MALPPFVNIIRLMLRARKEDRVIKASNDLAKIIKKNMRSVKILGPAPAVISKIRNQFRWNLVLKVKEPQEAAISLKEILKNMKRPSGVFITVDVDPISV